MISAVRPNSALQPIQIMIVDDSLTVRSILSRMIDGEADLEVMCKTSSAELALEELKKKQFDVVLLDLEMPGMGGLAALPKILESHYGLQILVVSSLAEDGAQHALKALSMGAADTMPKPRAGQFDAVYCETLFAKIRALGTRCSAKPVPRLTHAPPVTAKLMYQRDPQLIAIGASTGGIHAMCRFLSSVSPHLNLPILVTQHLPDSFMNVFAKQLAVAANRPACVAANGMHLEAGNIYVAPGTGHLSVRRLHGTLVAKITAESVPSGCVPSVDPMFSSIAAATSGQAIGVVLSGMGRDGTAGAKELCQAGGTIIVQDQDTSAVWGMPGAIAADGLASAILPPEDLGEMLIKIVGKSAWK